MGIDWWKSTNTMKYASNWILRPFLKEYPAMMLKIVRKGINAG